MEDESTTPGPRWSVGNGPAEQAAREGKPPRPEFWQEARPRQIDPALLALDGETEVTFHPLPGLSTGEYYGSAASVIAELQAQIDRQAGGFFTLSEVAHILATVNPGCEVRALIREMMDARVGRTAETPNGRRLPRHPGSKWPVREGENSFNFLWVTTPKEVDEWLAGPDKAVPDRFPAVPTVAPEVRKAATTSTTHKTKRRADPLAAVLTEAQRCALDATDGASVWAALVRLAESASRPAPLLGYVEAEGVKYRSDKAQAPDAYLSRDAFRKRFERAA